MMIFKKAIPRRAVLRGLGASIALPLLDGMVPALAAPTDTAAKPAVRLGFFYVPNGIMMEAWTPAAEGTAFELTPILEPLAAFRDRLVVLSGLSNDGPSRLVGQPPGGHSEAGATYLTGVFPQKHEVRAGISVDQIAAKEFGKQTQLESLEISLESSASAGGCDGGFSCAYTNTLSWRTASTPMPMENNPRALFERLFGDNDSTDLAVRVARARNDRSILDFVTHSVQRLQTGLDPSDRGKLTDWLDAIRDIERRIQIAEGQSSRELPTFERPAGVPSNFEVYAKLMLDLQLVAWQCDMTRVTTFMMGREQGSRSYPEIGVPDPHHPLTHHSGDPEKIAKVIRINIYHAKMFAYYVGKLRSTPDGNGSLLDNTTILYGSGLSDGNLHLHNNLPILLLAGAASGIKGGRHLRYPKEKETPLTNLYLTLLDRLGVPVEHLGDSTGELKLLSV